MAFARRIGDPESLYFVTFATVQWVDVFTRSTYVDIVLDSLRYCQKEKGLRIHAWCIMSNHVHLLITTKLGHHPSDFLRDFKKFTSKKIITSIEDKTLPESRRNWMLWLFRTAGQDNSKNQIYQFWQQENHPVEIFSNKFMDQKLAYIHDNPVKAGLVDDPWEYRYSSARDYMKNQRGLLDIEFL
ncbi:REP-associated tyrosine transposase [Dyadobacter sp. CY312]|uniref:REP-associated tyrosine transposase n=1 Tax=Dyadobacter sp. CY312 TaxID=2907303 RepID=UPI001F200CE8|nr:transposase [Dyadobacter sp. CY312]MCE7043179.1 transposase [Dyadobacter sp. CY312]